MRGSGKKQKIRLRKELEELRKQQRNIEYFKRYKKRTRTKVYSGTKRKSAKDLPINISTNSCQSPECKSCKIFALKTYFTLKGYSGDELTRIIDSYLQGGLDHSTSRFEPSGANELPRGVSVVFITLKGYRISMPIHVFLLQKTRRGYYIYSSWCEKRVLTETEWANYSTRTVQEGKTPIPWDEYEIDVIDHMPTTQGPFREDVIRERLENLSDKENLGILFGLTPEEIREVEFDFENIDIHIFNDSYYNIMRGSGKKQKTRIRKELDRLRKEQRNREYLSRSRMSRRKTMKRMSRKTMSTSSRPVKNILQNANNPEYTSCKYFAANEYFKSLGYSGKKLYNEVKKMIDGTDGLSENNQLPIFEPGAQEFPRGLALCFITYLPGVSGIANKVGSTKTPIIHGFLLENTPQGYFIYSSWGCVRTSTHEEYDEYSTTMYGLGETPVNIENYEIGIIKRKPSKYGPFSEGELRDALSNVKANLSKLFGLAESEIQYVESQFDHIQIQMYKEK